MKTQELYEAVTNGIIKELETGIIPWTKPWKDNPNIVGVMPMNAATGRGYSGINIPILWFEADKKGYPTHGWMTYRQAKGIGGQVRAGEKASTVVFTKKLHLKDKETEEQKTVRPSRHPGRAEARRLYRGLVQASEAVVTIVRAMMLPPSLPRSPRGRPKVRINRFRITGIWTSLALTHSQV